MKTYNYSIQWCISPTRYTPSLTLKKESFESYEERNEFLKTHHYWWERLPFVERRFSIKN